MTENCLENGGAAECSNGGPEIESTGWRGLRIFSAVAEESCEPCRHSYEKSTAVTVGHGFEMGCLDLAANSVSTQEFCPRVGGLGTGSDLLVIGVFS